MTVAASTARNQYSGNGSAKVFAYTFKVFAESDLVVTVKDALGNETVKTLNVDYTVSGVGSDAGGNVTFITAPASGETVTLTGDIPYSQSLDLVSRSEFDAEVIEDALDKTTRLLQQIREVLNRTIKLPVSSSVTDMQLPNPDNGKFLGWADGELANLALQTTALSVSAYAQTLLDDANAAAARVTLGENASGSFFTRKHNFSASAAPTTANDNTQGYSVGSWWFDTTGDQVYVCADAGTGAAVWRSMSTDRGANGFKNRARNGDMRIDQRNEGTALTVNDDASFYSVDGWIGAGLAAAGVFAMQRLATVPPAGFTDYLRAIVTTADASIAASDRYRMFTVFEGRDMADLGWGAAGAKDITVSFWARSSLTGTFSGCLRNGAGARSYPFTFTISVADTWEFKSITIPGDTTGTWPTDNTRWGSLTFDLGSGSTHRGTAGAWTAGSLVGATGAVNLISTLNAYFMVTGFQVEVGSAATEFERVPFGAALARCQRYFCKSYPQTVKPGTATGSGYRGIVTTSLGYSYMPLQWPVEMAKTPTITFYNHNTGAAGTWVDGGATARSMSVTGQGSTGATAVCTTAAASSSIGGHYVADAEI